MLIGIYDDTLGEDLSGGLKKLLKKPLKIKQALHKKIITQHRAVVAKVGLPGQKKLLGVKKRRPADAGAEPGEGPGVVPVDAAAAPASFAASTGGAPASTRPPLSAANLALVGGGVAILALGVYYLTRKKREQR